MLENLSIMFWVLYLKNLVMSIGFDLIIVLQKKQIFLLWLCGIMGKKDFFLKNDVI